MKNLKRLKMFLNNDDTYYTRVIDADGNICKNSICNSDNLTKAEAEKEVNDFNSKYYVEYYSEDEIKDFFNSIDFTPVTDAINQSLGLNLTYNIELYRPRYDYHILIKSNEDLIDLMPILNAAWRTFRVETFNGCIDCVKATGVLCVWLNIAFRYESHSGGSNASYILSANYYTDSGWKIRMENDRYNKED